MSDIWYMNVEERVYSLIKAFTYKKLKENYPNIMFVAINELPTDKTFSHVVYIHELPGVETGRDILNSGVNAYTSTFECIVSVTEENKDNTIGKKEEVKEIVGEIIEAFKRLNFNVTTMPTILIDSGTYSCPLRFRRVIGSDDKELLGN